MSRYGPPRSYCKVSNRTCARRTKLTVYRWLSFLLPILYPTDRKVRANLFSSYPIKEKQMVDVLANLATCLTLLKDENVHIPLCHKWVLLPLPILQQEEVNATSIFTIDSEDWWQPLIDYLEHGKLPNELIHQTKIWRWAPRFIYYTETLYGHSFDGALLWCLGREETNQAIEEAHSRICVSQQSGPKLHFWIERMGYYWLTMVKDCMEYAKKYQSCQFHSKFIHQSLEPLHPTIVSWPFDA